MHKNYYNKNQNVKKYFDMSHEASMEFKKTEEFHIIHKYLKKWDSLCELWCGEGSKIASFEKEKLILTGIDISETAINKAKKQYPNVNFILQDVERDTIIEKYDCTMSYFVLEHIQNPEKYIDKMISMTKSWWDLVLWFPNYWSPLFPSPPTLYKKNSLEKLIIIFKRIFKIFFDKKYYNSVNPITEVYECDYDEVSEIYMWKFRKLLLNKWLKIKYESSCWHNIPKWIIFKLYLPFKYLKNNLFKYRWPQCFMILEKNF